ncbi:MAG: hypothetical protein ABR927_10710 [Bacteroidales bacterium]|jgi:hypothetical protein
MRRKLIFSYTALLFSAQIAFSQYYETGQDPASLKWNQIKTGRFTVIYPEKYGTGGMLYAKEMDEAFSKLMSLFPEKKFTLPVVIHNYSIQSNGYVSWAPRRMELFPTPDQNGLPLAPEKQLAVHELTHVLQMESLNQGFSKVMSVFLGEQFTGIVASLLPTWFLEGDAVFAESALTESGRGRTPSFQKQLKALVVDNKKTYNYDKILNGSFKDFVPDYYEYGYQMVTWALAKNDPQIWNKVLKFTGAQPFTLNPVNLSLTRSSGLRKKTLWEQTYDSLKAIWTKDVSRNNPVDNEAVNPDKHGKYIDYYCPVFAGTDSIIAIKTSFSLPAAFMLINPAQKTEKRIHVPGLLYPLFISYAKGKLVWVETITDPRWENREFSVIRVLDIKTGIITKLTRKSRYLAASVSPDGNKIVAVENTVNNINSLVLIDVKTGFVLESVLTPGNVYLQHPQWSEDGKKVTFIFLADAGEGIMSFKLASQEWETLLEPARNDLQSSFLRNDSLFFVSSLSGTDNVYLLTPDKKTERVTRSRFGTIDVSPDGNKLLFGDYTSLGNNICSAPVLSVRGGPGNNESSSSFLINRFDIKPPADTNKSNIVYTPEPYRKWQHLFRFHSWMPFYTDIEQLNIDPVNIRPGVTIMTQNTLSTLISTLGYEYSADKRNLIHSQVTWQGWYPVFESQLDYGTLPQISKLGENIANPSNINPGINFTNTLSLPLQFSSGSFSQFVQPSVSADYQNQYIYIKEKDSYDYGQTIVTTRLYFTNYYQPAICDIYPRWAQVIDFNYRYAPFGRTIYGSDIALKTAFYFPGILPNNGIRIRFETEKQNPAEFLYGNFSDFPRGYGNIISTKINFLSADYVMPLVYPDFNLASFVYLKRIRTGLFYDYASGPGNSFFQNSANGLVPFYQNNQNISFKSFGFELLADFYVLRIPYMISAGVQSAWKSTGGLPSIEFLFNINIFGMTFGRRHM